MDTRSLSLKLAPKKLFHPTDFETTSRDLPTNIRTLNSVRHDREQSLSAKELEKLVSPGKFNLTVDDKKISKSNTYQLFKNLYGETLLTNMFFSESNVKNIQNLIRFVIHKEMGYTIDEQSYSELLTVMRSIFLEYSAHPRLITEKMPEAEKAELYKKYTDEVSRLNRIVVNDVVPRVASQLQQYLDYLRDASQPPRQMMAPENVSISGERRYRSVTQVLLGGDL